MLNFFSLRSLPWASGQEKVEKLVLFIKHSISCAILFVLKFCGFWFSGCVNCSRNKFPQIRTCWFGGARSLFKGTVSNICCLLLIHCSTSIWFYSILLLGLKMWTNLMVRRQKVNVRRGGMFSCLLGRSRRNKWMDKVLSSIKLSDKIWGQERGTKVSLIKQVTCVL